MAISQTPNIDRSGGTFTISISYTIPGYVIPESGETLYDTSWYAEIGETDGSGTYTVNGEGYSPNTVNLDIGFFTENRVAYQSIAFVAVNNFTGEQEAINVYVLNAGNATERQELYGADDYEILLGGRGNDVLAGRGGGDVMDGGAGNDRIVGGRDGDTLIGGTGADRMTGFGGDDLYDVDNKRDVVVENARAGTDTIRASINYTLGANIERLILTGTAGAGTGNGENNDIRGNETANVLYGADGNDVLFGYDGKDKLRGGLGDDMLDGGVGADRLDGDEGDDRLLGAMGNDRLSGGDGSDNIRGDDGNDWIDGGDGADLLSGGAGADTFVFDGHDGSDRVPDFASDDFIRFSLAHGETGPTSMEDLNIFQARNGTVIEYGLDSRIVLTGVMLDQISDTQFLFG